MHEKMMQMHGGSAGSEHKMPAMKKASFEVALKGKKQIAEGTMAFIFEKPKEFKFKAGQHIRMTLLGPPETDAEGDSRFFSLASTPQDKDIVIAMRMRDTAFKRVLKNMQTGSKALIQILLDLPHGAFALHEDATKPAVYIVGGIGIVPAYSMIKDATERKLPHKLYLFYSNRRPEDAPYLSELQNLARRNLNFKLVATMTEPEKVAKTWKGETDHINKAMLDKQISNLQSPIYYVSGLPEMVSSMKTILKDAGVADEQVQAEEFTGFNLNEIVNEKQRTWANRLLLIGLAVVVAGIVLMHVTGAKSLFHNGFSSLSFNNPFSYLFIGVVLVVILVKLKLLWALRHSSGSFMRDMKGLHKLSGRKK